MLLHYEFHILLKYLTWWRTALLPLFLLVWFFGGGTLLYLGARYLAKLRNASFGRSLLVNFASVSVQLACSYVLMVLVGLFWGLVTPPNAKSAFVTPMGVAGMLCAFLVPWWVICKLFRTSARKAFKAVWLTTVGQAVFFVPLLVAFPMSGSSVVYVSSRAICTSNLSSIGRAIVLYRALNDDRMPPDIGALIRMGQPPKRFKCPSAAPSADPNARPHDYFYLPADPNAPADRIILCDYRGNHSSGARNVLYAGMHVKKLTEDEFQRELARPVNAEFAKALREAERE